MSLLQAGIDFDALTTLDGRKAQVNVVLFYLRPGAPPLLEAVWHRLRVCKRWRTYQALLRELTSAIRTPTGPPRTRTCTPKTAVLLTTP